jgi:hypothetical protein
VIQEHVAAVKLLLDAVASDSTGALITYIGAPDSEAYQLPSTPPRTPYVVLRTDSMPLESDRLAQYSSALNGRVYIVGVGSTWDEAAWALDKTRGVLLDVVPVVAGRSVAPLALVGSSPIEADGDVIPPLFSGVDIYRLFST